MVCCLLYFDCNSFTLLSAVYVVLWFCCFLFVVCLSLCYIPSRLDRSYMHLIRCPVCGVCHLIIFVRSFCYAHKLLTLFSLCSCFVFRVTLAVSLCIKLSPMTHTNEISVHFIEALMHKFQSKLIGQHRARHTLCIRFPLSACVCCAHTKTSQPRHAHTLKYMKKRAARNKKTQSRTLIGSDFTGWWLFFYSKSSCCAVTVFNGSLRMVKCACSWLE